VTSNLNAIPKILRLEITQMKTTYLVYKQVNGVRQLAVATQAEWDAILKENRRLPLSKQRLFMKDCFQDGDELDCMYIEVSTSEYRKWNNTNSVQHWKHKIGALYTHLSLDASISNADIDSLHESVPSDFNLERLAVDAVLVDELRQALRTWKPWAEELLDLYLSDKKRSSTKVLCEKYRISYRAVQKRKAAFEKFILDFLKK